jgi:excisionase family DNA binding protein
MADQDVLTAAEFAELAKVTVRTVRRWAAAGVGPRPRRPLGSRLVRYRRNEVEAWLSGEQVREAM